MSLLKRKAQGTNTGKYLSSLGIMQFPSCRARVRTVKQVSVKQKAKITQRGPAFFGTKQKFFNCLVCPSTILVWLTDSDSDAD